MSKQSHGKIMTNLLFLVGGIVIGLVIVVIIAAVGSYLDPPMSLNFTKKIGNVKIIPLSSEEHLNNAAGSGFIMTKDGERFFYAAFDSNDKITDVGILRGTDIYFTMGTSARTGKWIVASYGRCTNVGMMAAGERYMDLNFDGQFDAKYIYDDKNELVLQQIYINQQWLKVDHLKHGHASAGQTKFIFDPNSGWRETN